MPQTRIRGNTQSGNIKIVGSGGGGSSTNPPGSSLTTDSFSVVIKVADSVTVPTDSSAFALKVSNAEAAASTPTEAVALSISSAVTDTVSTPTGGHGTVIKAGASTVTQTTGTGWTNPTNAQGVNDGTNATLNSAAGVGAANASGTLTGVFNTLGTPSTETQTGTVTLTFTAALTVGLLATGSLQLQHSVDGGANWVTDYNVEATTASFAPITLTGFTLANLGQLRFGAIGSVTGSATAAATATVDAVVASFTTTGSAG